MGDIGNAIANLKKELERMQLRTRSPNSRSVLADYAVKNLRDMVFDLDDQIARDSRMAVIGVRRDGFHFHDDSCESGTRWFVMNHYDRTDKQILEDLECASDEQLDGYSPRGLHDCTGEPIGGDASIKRGRKIAVVTQWRGLDV